MIRFISFLLGKQYEPCKGCEVLKQQLAYVNDEKKQLTSILIDIVSPKKIESTPVEFQPLAVPAGTFAKRRAALEAKERETARIIQDSKNLGRPDNLNKLVPDINQSNDINELEAQLGIAEE